MCGNPWTKQRPDIEFGDSKEVLTTYRSDTDWPSKSVIVLLYYVFLISLAFIGTCGNGEYRVSLDKSEDTVAVRSTHGNSIFTFSSESGIGGAEISVAGREWPDSLTMRLRYGDSREFARLEHFSARTESLFLSSALGRDVAPCFAVDAGEVRRSQIVGTVPIHITQHSGFIEIVIPAVLLHETARSLRVKWIDMYRE